MSKQKTNVTIEDVYLTFMSETNSLTLIIFKKYQF